MSDTTTNVVALVHATTESDRHIACADCNGVTGGSPMWVYPAKCGGCNSLNFVELPPPAPIRTFTLRICPVCGIIAVDQDELRKRGSNQPFVHCSGPWFAGLPTDRSHKLTPTQCVEVREKVPMSPLATFEGTSSCHVHPERRAVVLIEDTGEPLCAACYREHIESTYPAQDPTHAA